MSDVLVEGGWRARLITEEFRAWLRAGLAALDWFEPLGDGDDSLPDITWRTTPFRKDETIPVNTLVVSIGDMRPAGLETGSGLTEDRYLVWIDFYGATDELTQHVIADVAAICQGKYPSIGYTYEGFWVTERRPDDDRPDGVDIGDELFWVELEDVAVMQSIEPPRPDLRFWSAVSGKLIDENPS